MRAVTPGPIAVLLQVVALDLALVWQREDIGIFPFHEEGALAGGGYLAHELRIAKPTIRDSHALPMTGSTTHTSAALLRCSVV